MVRRQRRTGLLDDRARVILAALVEEHIRTATPVGSIALSDGYDLGVSPATVRGVLVELEELGLLMQPHTSAGRIPTDLGYRTYAVEIAIAESLSAVTFQIPVNKPISRCVAPPYENWLRSSRVKNGL